MDFYDVPEDEIEELEIYAQDDEIWFDVDHFCYKMIYFDILKNEEITYRTDDERTQVFLGYSGYLNYMHKNYIDSNKPFSKIFNDNLFFILDYLNINKLVLTKYEYALASYNISYKKTYEADKKIYNL